MKNAARFLAILAVIVGYARQRFVNRCHPGDALTLFGNVDIRQVALGLRVSGRLESMDFEEGDSVTKGQLLSALDKGPLEDSLALFKAQISVAEASLQKKLAPGTRPAEIAQAKARVEELETAFVNAAQLLGRQLELSKTGAAFKQNAADAKALHDAAGARLASAKEALELAEAGPRAEDIAVARAEVVAADAKAEQAERQLADTELHSPENGIVLTRAQEPGGIVATGATVYTLSLSSPVLARTSIGETNLGRVRHGMMMVDELTDSRPNIPYQGQIGFISPVAEFTPNSVETEELRTDLVYCLQVIIKEPDEALRQGMPVTLRIPNIAS